MRRTVAMSGLAFFAVSVQAIDFEAPKYVGSASGTVLTGQNGWYNPIGGSADWDVFTYAGNSMGIVANPAGGGDQFAGGVAEEGPGFARAQKDFAWSYHEFVVSYDVNHRSLGQFAEQNLGSWSLQPSTTNIAGQDLHRWDDPFTAQTWHLVFNLYNAAGTFLIEQLPGPAWMGLLTNHWYRIEHTISFVTNRWSQTSITDLHTGTTNTFMPTNWYMSGGSTPTLRLPTASRFFAGGSGSPGNAFALDNFTIVPEPNTILVIGAALSLLTVRRRVLRAPGARSKIDVIEDRRIQ